MDKIFYSRRETAAILNISTETLDDLANRGHIHRQKIGARTVFHIKEITRFSEELLKKGAVYIR